MPLRFAISFIILLFFALIIIDALDQYSKDQHTTYNEYRDILNYVGWMSLYGLLISLICEVWIL